MRLRALHPVIAVSAGFLLMFAAPRLARGRRCPRPADWAARRCILAGLQLIGGVVNLLLLAPVWMQIVHLLVADLLWIAFVMLGARMLAAEPVLAGRRITPP